MPIRDVQFADWFDVDSTDDEYPAGQGANTTTAGSSVLVNTKATLVHGVLVRALEASATVTIQDHAASALAGLVIPTDAVGYFPFGAAGIVVQGGISATLSSATTARAVVFFSSLS